MSFLFSHPIPWQCELIHPTTHLMTHLPQVQIITHKLITILALLHCTNTNHPLAGLLCLPAPQWQQLAISQAQPPSLTDSRKGAHKRRTVPIILVPNMAFIENNTPTSHFHWITTNIAKGKRFITAKVPLFEVVIVYSQCWSTTADVTTHILPS